jgi:hypothetical protein
MWTAEAGELLTRRFLASRSKSRKTKTRKNDGQIPKYPTSLPIREMARCGRAVCPLKNPVLMRHGILSVTAAVSSETCIDSTYFSHFSGKRAQPHQVAKSAQPNTKIRAGPTAQAPRSPPD